MSSSEDFCAITGASPAVAEGYLSMSNGELETAIQLFFDNPDLAHSFSAATSSRPARRNVAGREDADGVIHIDDSDDESFGVESNEDVDQNEARRIAAEAQAAEDAAMAQRLQDELYGANGDDEVRAPIASRTETLVGGGWEGHHVDDDDHHADMYAQMEAQRRAHLAASANPFARSIWNQGDAPSGDEAMGAGSRNSRAARLAELFRPPFDLMARLSWDDARDEGKETKKWILVNLQDMNIFSCQTLNRDIWRDDAVKELVREHFIFLQYDKNDISGLTDQFVNLYFPSRQHENSDIYPHVSIIDPRTGEQVKVWSGPEFPTSGEFMSQLVEFLDRYSLSANSKNPVAKAHSRPVVPDIDRMTEEEMLEMALKNSIGTGDGADLSAPAVLDPDAFTKAKSPEVEESEFAKIASDRPHEEPAATAPNTTRIQFRHANGRVIRRFALDDKVERIYEWLKAEPLESHALGDEFELKKMPGGDLFDSRDQTIGDAGLKQGTVMIEYN